ncbi:uncharacterized protein N7529_010743 [Penicillium soppii]|jgi:hypothetical protein|uniref:uncharacterized protein n=1 Tax=Penicillium soppii TaxID=69789 RepID=UPI0025495ABC|nr:uncharacterized protein N7529_010743 [Penicillium soppii]KAJ5851358.1 hypothetical protein N7529_010743 [Penicillium soppii]
MTQATQMQQPTDNVESMFPTNSGGVDIPNSEIHVDPYRSLDPARASLEDYNRSMLQYTQRQMSSFVDTDDSHRSSQSSGQSGRSSTSTSSNMSRNAHGPTSSVSNAAHLAGSKVSSRDMADNESATY